VRHCTSQFITEFGPRNNTALGIEAKKYTTGGLLVPDDLVTKLILSELKGVEDRSWLLDGRSSRQNV